MSSNNVTEIHKASLLYKNQRVAYPDLLDDLILNLRSVSSSLKNPLQEPYHHHFKNPGKLLRGELAARAALQQGVAKRNAIAWATAVELLHNASLIHDDLCDEDKLRHGTHSVAALFGDQVALCLGDAMIAASFLAILDSDGPRQMSILLARAVNNLAAGQADEFVSQGYPSWAEYERIVSGKTTPLLTLPIVGGFQFQKVQLDEIPVNLYFAAGGLIFQTINDLNNILVARSTGTTPSDFFNGRPNAAISIFKDGLNKNDQKAFDQLNRCINSQVQITPKTEKSIKAWWEIFTASSAMEQTLARLEQKLHFAKNQYLSLSVGVQESIAPFHQWIIESTDQIREIK